MQKRTSLKDIADRLGVSTALVSYVLNDQEKEKRVGAEIAKKIRQVAEELNYQPNQIARSLRMQSTKSIGMIVADIANPFFANLARIIENEANKYGYTVFFGSSDEDPKKSELLMNTLLNRQVDGFILAPAQGAQGQIEKLLNRKIPTVLIDRYFPEISVSHVCINNFQAIHEATEYLLNKGYKDISFICYDSDLIHMKDRVRGYTEAMEMANLSKFIDNIPVRFNFIDDDMKRVFDTLNIEGKNKNEKALLFATNSLSISGLFRIKERNLKIPEDLYFFGFDGAECFDLFYPPLEYVKQPLEEMGKESFSILMDLMKGSGKVNQITLRSSLIIR